MDSLKTKLTAKRWIFVYAGSLMHFAHTTFRVNMSMAIICMVKSDSCPSLNDSTSTNPLSAHPSADYGQESDCSDRGEFDWDKKKQSYALAAFFYGYFIGQIPAGIVAGKYGGRRVMGYAVGISSVLSVLTPCLARWGYVSLLVLRGVQGLPGGFILPAAHEMVGVWCPRQEYGRMVSFLNLGVCVAHVLTWSMAGVLCEHGFDNGWGSIFHIGGGLGFIATSIWFLVTTESPLNHPTITEEERDYILRNTNVKVSRSFKAPWSDILRSKAVWANLVTHIFFLWEYTMIQSSIPEVCVGISMLMAGQVADFIQGRYLNTTNTRKLIQTISFAGCGAFFVAVGFVSPENGALAIVLLSLTAGFMALSSAAVVIGHLDFAPTYAGVMYGITNGLGHGCGFITPVVAATMTPNKTQEEWRNVFYLCAGLAALGIVVFVRFSSSEIEPWALVDQELCIIKDQDELTIHNCPKSYSSITTNSGYEEEQSKTTQPTPAAAAP